MLNFLTFSQNITTETQKLMASDGEDFNHFGESVSISGDTVIIGDPMYNNGKGAVYIFEKVNGTWTETAKLLPSDEYYIEYFGFSVSISGDTAIIGAPVISGTGSAYIFEKINEVWTQTAALAVSDGSVNDYFGWSVSISGDTAIVGACNGEFDLINALGSAYIFEKINGTWTQTAKLLAGDEAIDNKFGVSVSVSGNTAIVGDYTDNENGDASGSAYIFEKVNETWIQTEKLIASDGVETDYFGYSVSIDEDIAIIGAISDNDNGSSSGSAYIFEKKYGSWNQTAKLLASDGSSDDLFGVSVSLSGNKVIIGASWYNPSPSNSAYIFEKVNGVWKQRTKLLASDISTGASLGYSVSISGNTAIAGAFYNESAYVYDLSLLPFLNIINWDKY